MDVAATAKVIQSGDIVAILVLLAVAAQVVVKGAFVLTTGRNQRRKEFLELWKEAQLRDDPLWLEEIFKLRYGAELAAPLIKHVLSLKHPSARLRRLATVSDFFELDASQSLVAWTRPRRARLRWFLLEFLAGYLAYAVLAWCGLMLIYVAWGHWSLSDIAAIFFGVVLVGLAGGALFRSMALSEARSTLAFVNDRPNPSFLQDVKRGWGLASSAIASGCRRLNSVRSR